MKRAEPRELVYPPGYFYEPVRLWDGLNRYVPCVHELLKINGDIGSAEMSRRTSESREARLTSGNADEKWAARGTIQGMAGDLFKDKVPLAGVYGAAVRRANTYEGGNCAQGHGGERYKSTRACVACHRAKALARKGAQ
jgi:hypothetical protein